jgi:hypothetical protein
MIQIRVAQFFARAGAHSLRPEGSTNSVQGVVGDRGGYSVGRSTWENNRRNRRLAIISVAAQTRPGQQCQASSAWKDQPLAVFLAGP